MGARLKSKGANPKLKTQSAHHKVLTKKNTESTLEKLKKRRNLNSVDPAATAEGRIETSKDKVEGRVRLLSTRDKIDVDLIPILGHQFHKPENKMTSYEKIELVEEGISKKALQSLKEKASLDYDQLARLLNVARATLINKKPNERFNKDLSDKILGLADIYSYGYEVFEDRNRFNQWIFRSNNALGGQPPFDLLHTSFGREEVKNLVGRIDYGVYS